jgi:hypothetical protein
MAMGCHDEEHRGRLTFWQRAFWLPDDLDKFTLRERVNGLLAVKCLRLLDLYLREGNKL